MHVLLLSRKVQHEFARRSHRATLPATRACPDRTSESAAISRWYLCLSQPSDERISEKQGFSSGIELGVQPCCSRQKAVSVSCIVFYVHASHLASLQAFTWKVFNCLRHSKFFCLFNLCVNQGHLWGCGGICSANLLIMSVFLQRFSQKAL